MLNKVQLIGRLGGDPIIRYTGEGKAVASFSIATSYTSNGSQSTEWHNIVAFGKTAELAQKYLFKGDNTYIEGSIKSESWEKEGRKYYKTNIIVQRLLFLNPKKDNNNTTPANNAVNNAINNAVNNASYATDEIPF